MKHTHQTVAVVRWWKLQCRKYGRPEEVLMHFANEGHRSPITAARLKAEGMRPGAPDLFLATAAGKYHGLFIEMKRTKGGRVSDSQWRMLYTLDSENYCTQVCHGSKEAIEAILEYLRG